MDRIERLTQFAILAIGTIMVLGALRTASGIFAPLALAFVCGVVLSPLTDFWERRGHSPAFGALTSLALTLVVLGSLIFFLQPLIARLVELAPRVWEDMQGAVDAIRALLRRVSDVADEVTRTVAQSANAAEEAAPAPSMSLPSVTDALLYAPSVLGQAATFGGALFFFLLTRGEIYDWVARYLSEQGEREQMARRLRDAERQVSRYFLTITFINAGLGAATAIAFTLIGLPDAASWGVVAFFMNFIVYLGPAIFAITLLFAGVAAFDGWMSLMPTAIFVALNGLEGQFVTPSLVGKRLEMNALLVFVAIILGIWLWGPIGGIIAIPLLLWIVVLSNLSPNGRKRDPLIEEAAAEAEAQET